MAPRGRLLTQKGGAPSATLTLYGGWGRAGRVRVASHARSVGPRLVAETASPTSRSSFLTGHLPDGVPGAVDWAGVRPGDTSGRLRLRPGGLMSPCVCVRGARASSASTARRPPRRLREVAGATVINIDDKDHVEQVRAHAGRAPTW